MSRIPSLSDYGSHNSFEKAISQFVEENGSEYEAGFSRCLLNYVKNDDVLKNFYVRFIYECEVVKIVIDKRTGIQLSELEMLVEKMETAPATEFIAIWDSEFHQKLFSIAEITDFFEWFRLQSKELARFLSGFWGTIGYQTKYYYELMEIHRAIFEAIRDRDRDRAVEMMERHFSILLLQLLGTVFEKKG